MTGTAMVWAILLLLTAIAALAVIVGGRIAPKARMPLAAALTLGLVGYAATGQPHVPAAPVLQPEVNLADSENYGEEIDASLGGVADRYGTGPQWQALADQLTRRGQFSRAARVMSAAVRAHPDSADIWVRYGSALMLQGGGATPASELAFDQAERLDPSSPGPAYFRGLGAIQAGDLDAGEAAWSALLARSPADAPWRANLEQQLAALRSARSKSAPTPAEAPNAPVKPSFNATTRP